MTGRWRIEPLPLYDFVVPGPEVLFQRGFDEAVQMTIYSFLLRGDGIDVLVDCGLQPDITALNADIRSRKGPQAGFFQRGQPLAEELRTRSFVPDAIIVTSFGPYAVGGLTALPDVPLLASERGLRNLQSPEEPAFLHPIPREAANILHRASTFAGEHTPFPGLTVIEVGVHHPASAALLIDTAEGTIAIADPVFVARNLLDGIALGAAEEAGLWHRTVRMLGGRAGAIIPIHDPDPTPISTGRWHPSLGGRSHG